MAKPACEVLEPKLVFRPGGTLYNSYAIIATDGLLVDECVYVLDFGRGDYKIGKTTAPSTRFVSLANELGAEFLVRYLIKTPNSSELEKRFHSSVGVSPKFRKEYFNLKRPKLEALIKSVRNEVIDAGECIKLNNPFKPEKCHRVTLTSEAYKIAEIESILRDESLTKTVSALILEGCSDESKKMLTRYILKKPENGQTSI